MSKNGCMPANPGGLVQKRRVNPNDPGSDFAVMSSSEPKHKGLIKREHFAGLAMQGLLAFYGDGQEWDVTAREAVACADALLAELNKE